MRVSSSGGLFLFRRRRAAYSSLPRHIRRSPARDTEVKQYNGCLLRPVPPGSRVHRRHYCRPSLSRQPDLSLTISHPFRSFSLSRSPVFFFVEFSPGLDTHHRKTMRQLSSPTGTMRSLVASVLVVVLVVATVVLLTDSTNSHNRSFVAPRFLILLMQIFPKNCIYLY